MIAMIVLAEASPPTTDPLAPDESVSVALDFTAGTPRVVDAAPDRPARTTLLQAASGSVDLRIAPADAWEIGLRMPLIAVALAHPGGTTSTSSRLGNLFGHVSRRWTLVERPSRRLDAHVVGGIGGPIACSNSDEWTCGTAFVLANGLSGSAEAELFQRDALPFLVGGMLRRTGERAQFSGSFSLPVFFRLTPDDAPDRSTRAFGTLPTFTGAAHVFPTAGVDLGLTGRAAISAPRIVGPEGGGPVDLALSIDPEAAFGTGPVTFRVAASVGVFGSAVGTWAGRFGLRVAR